MSDVTGYMKTDQGVTQGDLRALLDYNPDTGVFTWKRNGKQAGNPSGRYGRLQITINGRARYASRLAWLYVHGEWPQGQIDHINGDRTDNRLANLRVLDNANNKRNQTKAYANNTTGLLGVTLDKNSGRWRARIMVDGRSVALGHYDTPEQAHSAYVKAKRRLHPSWAA